MSTYISQVEGVDKIISAEFVNMKITDQNGDEQVYTFSSSYKHEVYENVDYTPLGGLLGIGEQRRDLKATSFDTTISLTGLDPDNIYMVLATPIRGSEVEIYRGFYNEHYELVNMVKRFTGIITGYTIAESRENDIDMFTITVSCSSYKSVLENNIGGRRTNSVTWNKFYSGADTSMDNIEKLAGAYFDFGVKV